MQQKQIMIIFVLVAIALGIFTLKILEKPQQGTIIQAANTPIPPLPQGVYDTDSVKLVDFQKDPKPPFIHAPCPIPTKLNKEIYIRSLPLGFNKEKNTRNWESLGHRLEKQTPISTFKKNIRDFVITLLKLQHPESHRLWGLSESGDLIALTRMAICDEVALTHFHIKGGINPAIGQDYIDNPSLDLDRQDRILFETLYRSCRMTASNAFRYTPGRFTRVAFFPTDHDWSFIQTALNINAHSPNEVICTYKTLDERD